MREMEKSFKWPLQNWKWPEWLRFRWLKWPLFRWTDISWPLLWARLKYTAWRCISKILLGIIYVSVISEGLRILAPPLGLKLWKLPLLGSLKNFTGTYKLDLAPFLAVFLLASVLWLWEQILGHWLSENKEGQPLRWRQDNHWILLTTLGAVLIGADILLFYYSVATSGWGGSTFSLPALIASLAYAAVLVWMSHVSNELWTNVTDLSR